MERENYIIRFANMKDRKLIVQFINNNWKRAQVINSNELFDFYYVSSDLNEKLNFALAENNEGEIVGVLGFIYSNNLNNRCIWLSCWKVVKTNNPMLAIHLLQFVKKETSCQFICCVNIVKETKVLYEKFMEYKTGMLEHYYRLSDQDQYNIAIVNKKVILPTSYYNNKIHEINDINILKEKFIMPTNKMPYKDIWYIQKRYFDFPIDKYKYKVYGIDSGQDKINSIFVTREVNVNGTKILRIVDFIGIDEEFAEISNQVQNLIDVNKYEYIDMVCYGIKDDIMNKAGFIKLEENDINIIPDRLTPLVKENDIWYFFAENLDNFYAFRADGDNDRPNLDNL